MMKSTEQNFVPQFSCASPIQAQMQTALFRILRVLVFKGDTHPAINDLPLSQLKCLHIVRSCEGMKMQEIAQRMEIVLPTLSQIVDKLVRRSMFVRIHDEIDRRVVRVSLTESAREIMVEIEARRQSRMDAAVARLTPRDVKNITDGLEILALAAEQMEAGEPVSSTPNIPKPELLRYFNLSQS